MILITFTVVILIRILIDFLFIVMHDIFILNHIQLPPPGWKLQIIKFELTILLATPIVGAMVASP